MSKNPHTFVRLKRIELRQLANQIGNDALYGLATWPASGEGREVKELTEAITRRLRDGLTIGQVQDALVDVRLSVDDLAAIRNNTFYVSAIKPRLNKMFRKTSSISYDERLGLTLQQTGEAVSKFLAELPAEPTGFERVAAIIPAQTLAPLKFEVDNGVLKLRRETAAVNKVDEQNVEAARTELGKAGAELSTYLTASNYDRALTDVVEEMRERIERRDNVIQLGLFALSFSMIVDAAEEELPPLWHAKMKAYSIGVGMFVSQHPAWVTFSENSMKAEFNPNDAKVLQQNGRELVTHLRKSRGLVDEDVPRSLSYLLDAISDRARPTARALFAAVTSIGNLVAAVTRGFGSILMDYGKSAHEGAKEGVKSASNLAAKTLLLGRSAPWQCNYRPSQRACFIRNG